ncbi:dof zinc finger protein 4-like isoform X2 [Aristolochia californica]|uniref:dof zinc finger protein 4-like isoform X2 n=1 Tax=Aristolochia californica TaxID=171875 RepID=UPI0035E05E50
MVLSSKQVSSDSLDWAQNLLLQDGVTLELPKPTTTRQPQTGNQNQQPSKPLRRHWTKGGTLRNVPVGGGRKNKRVKTNNNGSGSTANSHGGTNSQVDARSTQPQSLSLPVSDQKKTSSEILSRTLLDNPPQPLHRSFVTDSIHGKGDSNNNSSSSCSSGGGRLVGTTRSLPPMTSFSPLADMNISPYENERSFPSLLPDPLIEFAKETPYSLQFSAQLAPSTTTQINYSLLDPGLWNWDDLPTISPDLKFPYEDPQLGV